MKTNNMDKVDIIRKHIGSDDFYEMNGTSLLSKILEAMEEYSQQQIANYSKPVISNLLCGSFESDGNADNGNKCKCGREKWEHPKMK